ncbi:hypothetical protein R5R35_007445 [Gryllus longicercus]|uniref:Uncharacterized protein n=1 Tax=Gryllus longicercus TaxID=2509291 RepID=A0AAN9VDI8_9ORTH
MNLNLLSVSLEVSEEEKKLYDEFWALYAPRNAQIFTKLALIDEKTQKCSIHGYIVKITRANQCFQHCIGSTVHIVDDSMPFGSYFLVHLFATCEENPIPPEIHNIIRIIDMIVCVGEKSKKLFGFATSKANVSLFLMIGATLVMRKTQTEIVRVAGYDKYIWNIMRVNREKEIRNLNHIKCTGFFKFYGEVSAFSFCGEYSFVRVHCGFRLHHTIVIKLLNLTPSFKNLKVGDHVKFSRVRAEKMPQGDFSFVVDCNCCHVEKLN